MLNLIKNFVPISLDVYFDPEDLVSSIEAPIKEGLLSQNMERVVLLNPLVEMNRPGFEDIGYLTGSCQIKNGIEVFSGFYQLKIIFCPKNGPKVKEFNLIAESFNLVENN